MFRQTVPQYVPTLFNGNGYQHHPQQYQQEYQEYALVPHQAQGPPVPYQQPTNPFIAPLAPTPPPLAQSNGQKKKKRTLPSPAAPVVPQLGGVVAPALTAPPAPHQPVSNRPGHKWVLVAEDTAVPAQSTTPEVSIVCRNL